MTLTVERPDLEKRDARKVISKSFLVSADLCGQKAFLSIHDPRPFRPIEKVTFGSALDAGVELAIAAIRSGQPIPLNRVGEAAAYVADRDGIAIEPEEVVRAVERFEYEIAPHYDLTSALTQHPIRVEIDGLGDVDGHPDVILPSGIYDVKSSERAKPADAAATSYTELGLYGLMRERETGIPVPELGYWTWVRSKRPYWQNVVSPFTDAMRRISFARAAGYVRALEADQVLNAGVIRPVNGTFPHGPKFPSLCSDCQFAPWNEGPCEMAGMEEVA